MAISEQQIERAHAAVWDAIFESDPAFGALETLEENQELLNGVLACFIASVLRGSDPVLADANATVVNGQLALADAPWRLVRRPT
jgi:hypothetical protein